MKVAVTGATGFVGRHVVAALTRCGVQVIVAGRSLGSLYATDKRVTSVILDIAKPNDAFMRMGEPDVLLHLAWDGLPNYHAEAHVKDELPRQIKFVDVCVGAGLRRIVVTGTCLEYGMQSGCLDESLRTAPTTPYGNAKDRLRAHLESLTSIRDLQLTWTRLFYLYGAGQARTSLYSQLRAAVASGATEFPMSRGDQQRDFLPVQTAATFLAALTLNPAGVGVVNVCSGIPIQVVTLVRKWLQDWGADLQLNLGEYSSPDYEPHAFWGNKQKLEALLT